jgi:hypothetical protein
MDELARPNLESNPSSTVRRTLYSILIRTGTIPDLDSVATSTGLAAGSVRHALRALADAHVIVLEDDGQTIRFAPPFSRVATGFRVVAGDSEWAAPCAWDSFGIPAALHADAVIDASCAESGEAVRCGVRDGMAYGKGVIHLLVPAAHFWDDIVYT